MTGPKAPIWVEILTRLGRVRGVRVEVEPQFGYAGQLIAADGRRFFFKGTNFDINGAGAAALAKDKAYAARFLRDAGLRVPREVLVHAPRRVAAFDLKNPAVAQRLLSETDAVAFASDVGYPVFVKPNEGSEGDGVSKVADAVALDAALRTLFTLHDRVLVQAPIPGHDLRVIVLDGQVRAAFLRRPLTLIGDGRSTLRDLLDARLVSFARGGHGARIAPDDPRIIAHLSADGWCLDSVPNEGEAVSCLANANLSTGGAADDVTEGLSAAVADRAVRAAAALGLRFAGVDLLVAGDCATAEEAVVLEVNAAPGLSYFHRLGGGAAERVETIYVDLLDAFLTT